MKHLLVISNNVLSTTNNNGKTLYSFINGLNEVSVGQLFFSGEIPKINGYAYFRISDKDIIHGVINKKKRGNIVIPAETDHSKDDFSIRNSVGRNKYTLAARELLWHKKWKSPKLLGWLDDFKPDAILFLAGDAIFAYDICTFIQKRYNSRLTVYVTDDYVMTRKHESFLEKKRRISIRKKMESILHRSSCFYTISQPMQEAYKKLLQKDSLLAVNMVNDLRNVNYKKLENEIVLLYAGSFYYGRAEVLGYLAMEICEYNKIHPNKRAILKLYCNREPSDEIKKIICVPGASEYGGSLDSDQLKVNLNMADVLVFVESFDENQIEKVKYSLSTKVPEYMSIGKPILALGPRGIGSMEYLSDVALCVNDSKFILEKLSNLLDNIDIQHEYGRRSREKYLRNHDTEKLKREFVHNVIG